jgi:lysophospholipase L1-like esterase
MIYFWKSKKTIKLCIFAIVCIQIFIIANLVNKISKIIKTSKVLSATNVIDDKKSMVSIPNSDFKYYFGLEPSKINVETRYWSNVDVFQTINSDGLNERRDYSVEKPKNTYRIIVLGDSVTYGVFVDTKSNWTEVLEDQLNTKTCLDHAKYEVINLGVSGFDMPYTIKRYIDIGKKYNPDLIIWYESGSDLYRDYERMYPLIKSCQDEIKSKNNNNSLSIPERSLCWGRAQEEINRDSSLEASVKKASSWMEYFLNATDGARVVIVPSQYTNEHYKQLILDVKNRYPNLYLSDTIHGIDMQNETIFNANELHPNEKGHKLIADNIYKYIMLNKKLGTSCNN